MKTNNYKKLIALAKKKLKVAFESDILYGLIGLIMWTSVIVFATLSMPFYIYRFVMIRLAKLIAPGNVGEALSGMGNTMAVELLERKGRMQSTRCSIVVKIISDGRISWKEIVAQVQRKWVDKRDSRGDLVYPELQQYISTWMGIAFWKWEKNFKLEDHVLLHTVSGLMENDKFVNELMEKLINKPFAKGKSPWEIHLVNFENCGNRSPFIVKMHHAMADGQALTTAIISLWGEFQDDIDFKVKSRSTNVSDLFKRKFDFVKVLRLFFHLLADMGRIGLHPWKESGLWKVSNSKHLSGLQLYGKSRAVPIRKIKEIKNAYKVSFVAVLFSAVAGAMGRLQNRKLMNSSEDCIENLTTFTFLPLPHQGQKLYNKFTGTVLELPVASNLNSVTRLTICENMINLGKKSTIPAILEKVMTPLISYNLASITKIMYCAQKLPFAISIFRTASIGKIEWNGRSSLSTEFVTGLANSGLAFFALSYNEKIEISAIAHSTILSRDDLHHLMRWVEEELDFLHSTISSTPTVH